MIVLEFCDLLQHCNGFKYSFRISIAFDRNCEYIMIPGTSIIVLLKKSEYTSYFIKKQSFAISQLLYKLPLKLLSLRKKVFNKVIHPLCLSSNKTKAFKWAPETNGLTLLK